DVKLLIFSPFYHLQALKNKGVRGRNHVKKRNQWRLLIMNREFLKSLELSDEQIEKIMAEYGKSINSYKEKIEGLEGLSEKVQNYERQLEELQNALQIKEQELAQVDELQSKLKSYE